MVLDNGLPVGPPEIGAGLSCCHHWIIQPAVGLVSEGTCQKCGEVKEFKNSIDYETEWSSRRDLVRSDLGMATGGLEDLGRGKGCNCPTCRARRQQLSLVGVAVGGSPDDQPPASVI